MAGAPGPTQLKEPHMRYIIALYEIDRAYGGAEEGGWWYDTGELARLLALAPTEARAIQLADRANRLLERLQRHRRRVDSTLSDDVRYTAIAFRSEKDTSELHSLIRTPHAAFFLKKNNIH